MMTSSLPTPSDVLDQVQTQAPDVREAVLLDTGGRRLAGSTVLAASAHELLEQAQEPEVEIVTGRGSVFALRAERHEIAVVTMRSVLPSLMLYDLRMALSDLEVRR